MTLEEWEDEKDRELEVSLTGLFKSAAPPEPPVGFASRAMKAVRATPLPPGRRALRWRWTRPLAWAALVSAAATLLITVAAGQPAIAEALAFIVAAGVRTGLWLLGSVHITSTILDVLATTGGVFARAMSTREATAGVTLLAGVAMFSLVMLNRLLFSQKESHSW